MSSMETQLQQWISAALPSHSAIVQPGELALTPLSGDAGFRRYFRVNTRPTLLAVAAPQTDGNSESADYFAQLSAVLRQQGIPVPQIVECDGDNNFLLQEDFGNQDFLSVLNADSVELLYGEALMVLTRLQQISQKVVQVPNYSQTLLRQEMELFQQWFVGELLGYELLAEEQQLLESVYSFLEEQALSQPQCLVHRDYHSRNLMYREGEAPGVIDFQDMVWGPVTYDLVSLLRDCYIRWSPEQVKRWLINYGNLATELGIIPVVSEMRWQQWFDTMGMQRHIKVLGIFSRLFLRDKKIRYLQDLPLVLRYVIEVAEQYVETKEFATWIIYKLLPLIKKQPWYRDYQTAGDKTP